MMASCCSSHLRNLRHLRTHLPYPSRSPTIGEVQKRRPAREGGIQHSSVDNSANAGDNSADWVAENPGGHTA